jgi:thymidine kinase
MTEFVLYTGPMFSSKTTRLLSRIDRCKYQKKTVVSFKPKKDNRYTVDDQIVTHNDLHMQCYTVEDGKAILETVSSSASTVDSVAIDEIFMIPGASDACIELFRKGYDVYVSSIELSFSGQPFEEVLKIMPYCTQIIKCSAVCAVCQKDARYTYKKVDNEISGKDEIQVGGEEIYEPRCQMHHRYMRC